MGEGQPQGELNRGEEGAEEWEVGKRWGGIYAAKCAAGQWSPARPVGKGQPQGQHGRVGGGWEGKFPVSAGEGPMLLSAVRDKRRVSVQWERDSPKVGWTVLCPCGASMTCG